MWLKGGVSQEQIQLPYSTFSESDVQTGQVNNSSSQRLRDVHVENSISGHIQTRTRARLNQGPYCEQGVPNNVATECTWKRQWLNGRYICADGNKVPPPQQLILSHFPLSDSSTSYSREQSRPDFCVREPQIQYSMTRAPPLARLLYLFLSPFLKAVFVFCPEALLACRRDRQHWHTARAFVLVRAV